MARRFNSAWIKENVRHPKTATAKGRPPKRRASIEDQIDSVNFTFPDNFNAMRRVIFVCLGNNAPSYFHMS